MRWLMRLFRRSKLEAQLDSELRFHIDERTAELIAGGAKPAQARRQAMIEFGGVERAKEECREVRGWSFLETLTREIRYALRSLRRSPGFTAIAILTLALGIGGCTVIFSALYGVLYNTFPFPHADRVTSFAIQDLSHPGSGREDLSMREFLYYRAHNDVFEDISGEYGGFGSTPVRWTTGNSNYQFDADYLSVNSFKLFGENAVVGRLPTDADVKPGATPVFVIGYKLWKAQFNGDPKIVGRYFTLNGVPRVLVGVMPPRFRWAWVDVWIPFTVNPAEALTDPALKNQGLYTVGRLKPGVSMKAAAANLDVVAHQYAKIEPRLYPKQFDVTADTLANRVTGGFHRLIYPLFYASLILLLIACSNVANLLLSRATTREKEIAIRASLGATQGRLVRQFLLESLMLGVAGCLGGCLLAWLGIRDIVPLIPYNAFPQEAVIQLNPPVLAFALGIALVVALIFGLVPAIQGGKGRFQSRLMALGRGADAGGLRHGWLRGLLVVVEVALSITLLIGAGLLLRTTFGLEHVNFGYDPAHLLVFQVSSPQSSPQTLRQALAFEPKVLRAIEAVPGVVVATVADSAPPYGGFSSEIEVPGVTHASRWSSLLDMCSPGYFAAFQMHLLQGRLLSETDIDGARRVAVINEAFARKYLGGVNPLGYQIQFRIFDQLPGAPNARYPKNTEFQIIGVVSNVRNYGLRQPPAPEAYLPYPVWPFPEGTILLRSAVNPTSLLPSIQRTVWAIDSDLAVTNPATVESMLNRDVFSSPRFEFTFAGVFAAIGLLLVMTGIFSVMAYTVSLRFHEIGIRLALGAQGGNIFGMVLKKGLALVGVGIAVGLLASYGLTRYLANQLWGVKPTDPATFLSVVILIVLAGVLACYIPARRAARVDPVIALRQE